jgi:hypothetical protein
MAAKNKCLAQMNKSGRAGKATKKATNPASRVDPMGADHLVVPAIKQALSMLGQAREALIFAQCPAAVAKVRQAIKSTQGALRTAERRVPVTNSGVHSMARSQCLLAAVDR